MLGATLAAFLSLLVCLVEGNFDTVSYLMLHMHTHCRAVTQQLQKSIALRKGHGIWKQKCLDTVTKTIADLCWEQQCHHCALRDTSSVS